MVSKVLEMIVGDCSAICDQRTYFRNTSVTPPTFHPIQIHRDLTFSCLESTVKYSTFIDYGKALNCSVNRRLEQQIYIRNAAGELITIRWYHKQFCHTKLNSKSVTPSESSIFQIAVNDINDGWRCHPTHEHKVNIFKVKSSADLSNGTLVIDKQIIFDDAQKSITLVMQNRLVDLTDASFPKTAPEVIQILIKTKTINVCSGVNRHAYSKVLHNQIDETAQLLKNRYGATVGEVVGDKIYALKCENVFTGWPLRNMCRECRKINHYLLQVHLREESHSKKLIKTRQDLIAKLKRSERTVKALQKKNGPKELEKTNCTDKTLRAILKTIYKGVTKLYENLQVTACEWEGCSFDRGCHDTLQKHVQQHLTREYGDNMSLPLSNRSFKCHWGSCSKQSKKFGSIKIHLYSVHCLPVTSKRLLHLLHDQAKAILNPTKSMKWHPEIIKFAILNYHSVSQYRQLTDFGCIKLPNVSTIRSYKYMHRPLISWNHKERLKMLSSEGKKGDVGVPGFDDVNMEEGDTWDSGDAESGQSIPSGIRFYQAGVGPQTPSQPPLATASTLLGTEGASWW